MFRLTYKRYICTSEWTRQFNDTAVYCENSTKRDRLHAQNADLYVGVGGTCDCHWTLNGYM